MRSSRYFADARARHLALIEIMRSSPELQEALRRSRLNDCITLRVLRPRRHFLGNFDVTHVHHDGLDLLQLDARERRGRAALTVAVDATPGLALTPCSTPGCPQPVKRDADRCPRGHPQVDDTGSLRTRFRCPRCGTAPVITQERLLKSLAVALRLGQGELTFPS